MIEMPEKSLGRGGTNNPGRGKLPEDEKKNVLRLYTKDRYREQLKQINYNLNNYGTIEPPK
jgi:transcription initiation factor TFIID subunit TAF12